VVVKVLHPDLVAGVSARRFERDVRLSARPQHPHVVPLLSAGEVGRPHVGVDTEGRVRALTHTPNAEATMTTGLRACAAVALALLLAGDASAQASAPDSLEALIRRLDAAEAQGLLHRDSTALRKIWAPDFTVNNPRNGITHGADGVVALIRNGTIDYSSFAREIETILFHDGVVIVMGAETITPVNKAPYAGQTVRRRFTHFWMRRGGEWRLTARHANVVCPT
jgi:hypothetical protein